MSYADATLDLTSIPVACLAGANGAGKSALLDATTWALWEEARSSSDELIRLGQREMWVDLRFEHEGQVYRVRRSRQRSASRGTGKGTSKGALEFQVFQSAQPLSIAIENHGIYARALIGNGNGNVKTAAHPVSVSFPELGTDNCCGNPAELGAWRTLTGPSMRETQRLISDLLRMDYQTFVNSAYLKQGRADEFTTKQASERKQILGEILGLSYFDRLQEKCKEHLRVLKTQRELTEHALERMPELTENLARFETDLAQTMAELKLAEAQRQELEEKISESAERRVKLHVLEERLTSLRNQHQSVSREIPELKRQLEEHTSKLTELNLLIGSQGKIELEAKRYEQLRSRSEKLDGDAFTDHKLRGQKMEARSALSEERNKIESKLNMARRTLEQLRVRSEELTKLTSGSERTAAAYADFKALIQKESEYAKKSDDYSHLCQRVKDIESAIGAAEIRLEAELEQKLKRRDSFADLVKGKDQLELQRQSLEGEAVELEKLESELERIEHKGHVFRANQESLRNQIVLLQRSQSDHQIKIAELNAAADSSVCPLCSGPIVDRAAVIERYQKSIKQARKEEQDCDHKIEALEEDLQELRRQYARLKERLGKRKELDNQIGQFRERLSAARSAQDSLAELDCSCAELTKKLSEKEFAHVERSSLLSMQEQLSKLEFHPATYSNLQSEIRAQRSVEGRYFQLQKDLSEFSRVQAELPVAKTEVELHQTLLGEEGYGKELRVEIASLEEKLSDLNYDREEHETVKKQLAALLPELERFKDLQRALNDQPIARQNQENCQALLTLKEKLLVDLQNELAKLTLELESVPSLDQEISALKPQLTEAQSHVAYLAKQAAIVESRCDHLKEDIAHLETKAREREQMKQLIDDYVVLAEAFGKKGIQAIIIENSIPEIESDANRILSRLTDSRMHVGLITQQKNKSGNLVETLDLVIADEVGTRNYELYSGGEAFKVNFAVRVALARLLARRAGAKLETLIIDEGFGSQDDTSRDRLVRAIRSVQSDFSRILVITHFTDVKEMFPTHILISKHNGASRVSVLG